jgi:hypothetical protein
MREEECRKDQQMREMRELCQRRWEGNKSSVQKNKWKKEIIFSIILHGSCDNNLKIHFLLKGRR